jgi:hypothetical protein
MVPFNRPNIKIFTSITTTSDLKMEVASLPETSFTSNVPQNIENAQCNICFDISSHQLHRTHTVQLALTLFKLVSEHLASCGYVKFIVAMNTNRCRL